MWANGLICVKKMTNDLASFKTCIFVNLMGIDCILEHHLNFRFQVKPFQGQMRKIWNKREGVQRKVCTVLVNYVDWCLRYRIGELGPWSCQLSYYAQSILFDCKKFTAATGSWNILCVFIWFVASLHRSRTWCVCFLLSPVCFSTLLSRMPLFS